MPSVIRFVPLEHIVCFMLSLSVAKIDVVSNDCLQLPGLPMGQFVSVSRCPDVTMLRGGRGTLGIANPPGATRKLRVGGCNQ